MLDLCWMKLFGIREEKTNPDYPICTPYVYLRGRTNQLQLLRQSIPSTSFFFFFIISKASTLCFSFLEKNSILNFRFHINTCPLCLLLSPYFPLFFASLYSLCIFGPGLLACCLYLFFSSFLLHAAIIVPRYDDPTIIPFIHSFFLSFYVFYKWFFN